MNIFQIWGHNDEDIGKLEKCFGDFVDNKYPLIIILQSNGGGNPSVSQAIETLLDYDSEVEYIGDRRGAEFCG